MKKSTLAPDFRDFIHHMNMHLFKKKNHSMVLQEFIKCFNKLCSEILKR